MTLVSELDLPAFDYMSDPVRGDDFHAAMDALRAESWLAASPPFAYIVLDREAASFFLRTRAATFPGLKIAELFEIPEGPLLEQMRRNILHLNGEDHRRLRNLVAPAFTPRAADAWRPAMRAVLDELLAPLGERIEVVQALCKPYPARVIAAVMGAPASDAERLADWSAWIQRQFDPPSLMTERERIERAVAEFYAYAHALLARRRAEPAGDLMSQLVAAGLDDDELVNLVLNVLVGGVDTSQSQLAQALRLLAADPARWAALRADPARVPEAVEEALRREPITPFTARLLHEEVTYRDVTFPAGTVVMVASVTANREDGPLLTFGAGPHYCLGANLARAELEEALHALTARWETVALDGEPELGSIQGVYGVERLPLRVT